MLKHSGFFLLNQLCDFGIVDHHCFHLDTVRLPELKAFLMLLPELYSCAYRIAWIRVFLESVVINEFLLLAHYTSTIKLIRKAALETFCCSFSLDGDQRGWIKHIMAQADD